MTSHDLITLSSMWLEAKESERCAIEDRREIEDRLKSLIGVSENLDGTETARHEGYVIKIVGRLDRKIDSDKLQELAAENGLTEHLSTLFRWKPEINMARWRAAAESITKPLAGAITTKPGRPSFSITKTEV